MARTIGAVILGYVVIVLFVMITFSVAYLLLGTEGAFQPGSYAVSGAWIAVSIVLSILGAVLGGYVCAVVAKGGAAVKWLAALVLVLGLALAIPTLGGGPEAELARTGGVGNFEAMQSAVQPTWITLLNPFIGAIGVLLGGRWRRSPA